MRDTHDVRIYGGPMDGRRRRFETQDYPYFYALESERLVDVLGHDEAHTSPVAPTLSRVQYEIRYVKDLDDVQFAVANKIAPRGKKLTIRGLLDERADLIDAICSDSTARWFHDEHQRAEGRADGLAYRIERLEGQIERAKKVLS